MNSSVPSLRCSTFSVRRSALYLPLEYAGAVLCALWLLLQVCAGATDLRRELHELGLD